MNDYLWSCLVELCIASYLAPRPNKQLRRMARRFLRTAPPGAQTPLQLTIQSRNPVQLVRLTLEELEKNA